LSSQLQTSVSDYTDNGDFQASENTC